MIPTRIGQHFEGGYLAGVIRVKDSAYLILAAPKSTELHCRSLPVGGHADLYLPSRDELELCYRVFKPTDQVNVTYTAGTFDGNLSLATGTNLNSIPTGAAYTEINPARTIVTAFRAGSVEAFNEDWYWTSTESSSSTNISLIQLFSNSTQTWHTKTNVFRVRGIRRVLID